MLLKHLREQLNRAYKILKALPKLHFVFLHNLRKFKNNTNYLSVNIVTYS